MPAEAELQRGEGGVLFHHGLFGMDVGFETLKIAQLHRPLGSFELWGKVEVPLPAESVTKNGIQHIDEIAANIKQYLPKAKPHPITGKKVIAALPESLTFTKTLVLPLADEREIRQAMSSQANQFLPVAPQEVYQDFIITKKGPSSAEVLLIALDRHLVDSFVEAIDKVGFSVARLATKQVALANLLFAPDAQDNVVIVDIGTKISKISLFELGSLITTSTVAIGAEAIQAGQHVTVVIEAIRKLIQFRSTQTKRQLVLKEVKLTGAGSLVTGLTESLQVALNLPVGIAKPYLPIKGFQQKFAVATGLTLAHIG